MKKTKKKKPQTIAETAAKDGSQDLAASSESVEPSAPVVRSLRDNVEELLKDQPVYVNSIGAGLLGLELGSVLREMQQARAEMIRFYMGTAGGNKPFDEAVKLVNGSDSADSIERALQRVFSESVNDVCWSELERLYTRLPNLVKKIWQLLQTEASKELESGHRMAATLESTDWQHMPYKRAQFIALRNGFIEEWQPKGAIERSLIDMMAQQFNEYLFWSAEVHRRSSTDGKMLYTREEERRAAEAEGHWLPPRVYEQDAIEHAVQMLDRYNRLFLRTLRQLRDLRRYSTPVTINNPAQVNIAADGGQQVNAVKVES